MTGEVDWDPVRALAQRVLERGEALVLTEETRALLREIRRRIREGSNWLSDALQRAYRLRDAGDLEGARKQLEDVLTVEVVPLYREEAEIVLEKLAQRVP